MKARYRMFRRGSVYWCQDNQTRKQETLRTKDRETALRLLHSKNEAHKQPAINLQIARAYLVATDPAIATRSWQTAMHEIVKLKTGPTQTRWKTAIQDRAFDRIRNLPILETRPDHFLRVLETGKVSSNVYLRRIHNFALAMNWLPWPVIPLAKWPAPVFRDKRAITWDEHRRIVEREQNPERRLFYELCWHLGGSQGDTANLKAEDVNWEDRVISFCRQKTKTVCLVRFGSDVTTVLRNLPGTGPLFPYLRTVRSGDRATEFKQRCEGVGIKGVSLHSYRYAWAERALECGYPERFAQEALGHNSKAVHRVYARKAKVTVPSLEEYQQKIVRLPHVSDSSNKCGNTSAGN